MPESSRLRKPYVGFYGSTAMVKQWCNDCESMAFVIDNELACCGAKATVSPPTRMKIEVISEGHRSKPTRAEQRVQLEAQQGKCLYCDRELRPWVFRNGKAIKLQVNWDHFVPFAYSQENDASNFVASCHVCNKIKGDLMFQTVDEARVYILHRWSVKGYSEDRPTKGEIREALIDEVEGKIS